MYELISVINVNGTLIENIPQDFYLPEDLKRFRELTTNHIVVMGRKTFDTLKTPLSNRINIVITRNTHHKNSINVFYCTLEELDGVLQHMKHFNKKVFVIGGGEIYSALLDKCDTLHFTIVGKEINNSTYEFPFGKINRDYSIVKSFELYYSDMANCNYTYVTYHKNE
jgi:dihydrofolate reductase